MAAPSKPTVPRPQFDPVASDHGRRFERLFLFNRTINAIISHLGKFALSLLIWPRFIAPFRWKLTRYPLPLINLPPQFANYKILHLTDLHVGKTRESYLAAVIQKCLQEKPDLVVITGDLIDYGPDNIPILERLLIPLVNARIPDGIIAILGNHDYHEYSWRHIGKRSAHRSIHKRLLALLHRLPITVLRNQQHRIHRNDASFTIVGLDEMWTGRADPYAAFQNLTPADPILCLQHNPDGIEFLQPFPWQYMLCGHSHGGQALFPFLGALYIPMKHRHYLSGHFHFSPLPGQNIKQRTMFVSKGLGYTHPIRLRCAPEATLFTLQRA